MSSKVERNSFAVMTSVEWPDGKEVKVSFAMMSFSLIVPKDEVNNTIMKMVLRAQEDIAKLLPQLKVVPELKAIDNVVPFVNK